NEGSSFTIGASSITDPSQADTTAGFHYSYAIDGVWQVGNGFTYGGSSSTATGYTHTFDDGPATHTVTERIFDKDGGFFDCVATITVDNVNPTAGTFTYQTGSTTTSTSTISGGQLVLSAHVNEGSSFSIDASSVTDPSQTDTSSGFRYAYA